MAKKNKPKELERRTLELLKQLVEEGVLKKAQRVPDGLAYVPHPGRGTIAVPTAETFSDFDAFTPKAVVVLIECKHSSGKSIPVLHLDPRNPRKKPKGSGLKPHQKEALIDASECGGYGYLIASLGDGYVYALDGLELAAWDRDGDVSGNYGSISKAHLMKHGRCLGTFDDWTLPGSLFGAPA